MQEQNICHAIVRLNSTRAFTLLFLELGFKDRPNYSILRVLHSTTDRQVYKVPVVFRVLNQFLSLIADGAQ